jgi:hypothetical protein
MSCYQDSEQLVSQARLVVSMPEAYAAVNVCHSQPRVVFMCFMYAGLIYLAVMPDVCLISMQVWHMCSMSKRV